MNAVHERRDTGPSSESNSGRPKLEVVKPPESLESQIQKLTQRHRSLEGKIAQMQEVLQAYNLEDLSDPVELQAEKDQKKMLEDDLKDATTEWERMTEELDALMGRKELSSAWDENTDEGGFGVPIVQPGESSGIVETVGDRLAGEQEDVISVDPDEEEQREKRFERKVEVQVSKKELLKQLPEKQAELEAARRAFEVIRARILPEQQMLERKIHADIENVERAQASVIAEKSRFNQLKPIYRSILLQGSFTNKELVDQNKPPQMIDALQKESSALETEIRKGPPKRGVIGLLKSFMNGDPSWEERVKVLRQRDDEIDVALREYGASVQQAKQKNEQYTARWNALQDQKVALGTNANPDFARYTALQAELEQAAKKVSESFSIVKNLEEVTS